jgi:hypothetical protein
MHFSSFQYVVHATPVLSFDFITQVLDFVKSLNCEAPHYVKLSIFLSVSCDVTKIVCIQLLYV